MDKSTPYNPLHQEDQMIEVSQPGSTTVIVNQPKSTMQQITISDGTVNFPRGIPRDWSTGVFGCFEDIKICIPGLFCHPCSAACLATDMGEPCCTPCCAGTLAMRANFRGKHNIQFLMKYKYKRLQEVRYEEDGSLINDCCTLMFCGMCATCQMHRELNNIKAGRAAP